MKSSKLKHRVIWTMSPVTRTVSSKKDYKRTKSKTDARKEINSMEGR